MSGEQPAGAYERGLSIVMTPTGPEIIEELSDPKRVAAWKEAVAKLGPDAALREYLRDMGTVRTCEGDSEQTS